MLQQASTGAEPGEGVCVNIKHHSKTRPDSKYTTLRELLKLFRHERYTPTPGKCLWDPQGRLQKKCGMVRAFQITGLNQLVNKKLTVNAAVLGAVFERVALGGWEP